MVSDVSKYMYKVCHDKHDIHDKSPKLSLTLYDKDKYVVRIRNLNYYSEKGLILTNIHRCIRFDQSEWLQ